MQQFVTLAPLTKNLCAPTPVDAEASATFSFAVAHML
jgi:hypothetical protein